MKVALKLAALVLAATLGSAHAKDGAGGNGPPAVPPTAPAALDALLDSYLIGVTPPPFAGVPSIAQLPPGNLGFDDNPGLGLGHIPQIPEPETYALMLAGLGVLALAGKRRRNGTQEPRLNSA